MDKEKFLRVAHIYYALGIVSYASQVSSHNIEQPALEEHYSYRDDDSPYETVRYFSRQPLFEKAVNWLAAEGVIDLVHDDFGPTFLSLTFDAQDIIARLAKDKDSPFYKHQQSNNPSRWANIALQKLDEAYGRLGINEADFDATLTGWEPLPLDREDPTTKAVEEKISAVVDKAREDNGYASTHPEEREYVLSALKQTLGRLRESATISVEYLRLNTLLPLGRLIRRFGPAAIGVAAVAARDALREWLTKNGIKALDWLFHT